MPKDPSDWWTPELHEEIGNRYDSWLTWADAVWEAAKLVRSGSAPAQLPDGTELMTTTAAVYAMLLGYTLECTLKGLWVKLGNKIVVGGRYRGVAGSANHDLLGLARKVGITATDEELDALDRLTPFVRFAGRYPISVRADDMKPRSVPGRSGKTVPGFYSREDFAAVERLRNRFMTRLRFDKIP